LISEGEYHSPLPQMPGRGEWYSPSLGFVGI
jgi:hypothetical protein